METETYKNAKLILERFDPDSNKKLVSLFSYLFFHAMTLTFHNESNSSFCCCFSRQELESPSVVRHMPVKPGQGSAALRGTNTMCTSYPFFLSCCHFLRKTSNVSCLRAAASSCHPQRPLGDGQPCERSRRPPSACLRANLAWTSFPLGSGRTPGEEPVDCGCSAELDEEACDLWNTCSRIR